MKDETGKEETGSQLEDGPLFVRGHCMAIAALSTQYGQFF